MGFSTLIRLVLLSLIATLFLVPGDPAGTERSATHVKGSSAQPIIIFGFLGGFVSPDNPYHEEVRLAARLRKEYAQGAVVETYSNHSGGKAYRRILELLDTDHDGRLSTEEKQGARIILYGHSWGASESVGLARRLQTDGIPVLLTVQVDSVEKIGQNDRIIPANVVEAANFFQKDGLLQGQREIRAADPGRTHIQGNFEFGYQGVPYDCVGYPWYARVFMKAHTQIESDPKVWNRVETLIHSVLPSQAGNTAGEAIGKR